MEILRNGWTRTAQQERRREFLALLDTGADRGGKEEHPLDLFMARSLASEFSDDEFLDLLASLLAVEG